jgi:hypothetical protein
MAGQLELATVVLDLEAVLRQLHSNDIRVGIQAYDEGIQVWISDRLHRVREERLFKQSSATSAWREDSAALWLHAAALRLFPDTAYARDFKTGMLEVRGEAATVGVGGRSGSVRRAATRQPPGPLKSYRLKGHKAGKRSSTTAVKDQE